MSRKDQLEVSSLADEIDSGVAPSPTAPQEGGGALELDWGAAKQRQQTRAVRQAERRRIEVRAVDWGSERRAAKELVKSNRGIWLVTKLVVALLGLRLVMSLFGAADANAFTRIVYEVCHVMALPFAGYLPDVPLGDGQQFEPSVLAALGGYFVVGALLARWLGSKEGPAPSSKPRRGR